MFSDLIPLRGVDDLVGLQRVIDEGLIRGSCCYQESYSGNSPFFSVSSERRA